MSEDVKLEGAQDDTEAQIEETKEEPQVAGKTEHQKAEESLVELKFPDTFDESFMTKAEITELFKKHGAKQEALNDLVPTFSKMAEKIQEQSMERWKAQVEAWAKESEADNEFGGDKFDENIKTTIRPVIDRWGSKELVEILDQTGMAEHPAILRFLYRIGKDVAKDGRMIFPGPEGGIKERSFAEMAKQMYPSMDKDNN